MDAHLKRGEEEAEKFDPSKCVESGLEIKKKYVAKIDRVVCYGRLNLKDSLELTKIEDSMERAVFILWKALQKADPKLSLKTVENFPLDTATAILGELGDDFLSPQKVKPLKAGSE